MKFVRFTTGSSDNIHLGVMEGEAIQEIEGDLFANWSFTGESFLVGEVILHAPLVPNQIYGIGANYVASQEQRPASLPQIPVFFLKPTSSVIGPDANIDIPHSLEEVKFEAELAVIIGQQARNISEADVFDYIFGYTIGNDVTAPQYFHPDGHWTIGKAFDTFTPLGPVIETSLDPFSARIQAFHNGVEKQNSTTDLMIIPIPYMISYLSAVTTLMPGDVILTGAPLGAGFLQDGDTIECHIEGIGVLRNVTSRKHVSVSTE